MRTRDTTRQELHREWRGMGPASNSDYGEEKGGSFAGAKVAFRTIGHETANARAHWANLDLGYFGIDRKLFQCSSFGRLAQW